MAILFAAAITSYVISFLIIPVIIKYSLEKNLVDIPGRRKIHKRLTPSMGGIAIFIAFFIASMVWIEISDWKQIRIILMSLFTIFFMGVRDDIIPLRPYMKIIGQIMASSLLIFLFDLRLRSFYGIFGIYEIPFIVSCIITVFTIIVVTNSFNLIDGLDGLAGTIASVALAFFGISFYLAGDDIYATLSFCMLGAIVAFLFFNWEPSEIFMGDTGALVIGMMLSILAIRFIDLQSALPVENIYRYKASISGAVAVLCIPLADTLRIFILRLIKKQSPFKPDKNHIHHTFLRLGFSHSKSTVILAIIQGAFILIVFMLRNINDNYLMLGIISAWGIGSLMIQQIMHKRL
jgi:UDP-GlcNAc:undecaprenyl-phosphate/decaprenyl-phosphate GlcNAc-1-phosphate transferase